MSASISFSICNVTLGEISTLGVFGLANYNTGALIFTVVWFIIRYFRMNKKMAQKSKDNDG